MNRRTFILAGAAFVGAAAVPGVALLSRKKLTNLGMVKKALPRSAAVVWYSQTGHTRRYGRLIAKILEQNGVQVTAGDYRRIDRASLAGRDLLVVGTPVAYADVPSNLRAWLEALPRVDAVPAAAFVSFGGPGDNQLNTGFTLLELLASKGALPVGMQVFGNMSAFAPTWSLGNSARTLGYRHLPNAETYSKVRAFATKIYGAVAAGEAFEISKEPTIKELFKGGISQEATKLCITNHTIDETTCIGCGTCIEKCPVGAITRDPRTVVTARCIACLGCVNNCPTQAVQMSFLGKKVYGFGEFLRRNQIEIEEPAELVNASEGLVE